MSEPSLVRRFLQEETNSELSKPALETLAIVAYRGPVTKSQIEAIRGVASETMLRNLLARGLILEAGKSQEPGRPIRYAISHSFLQHFGLTSAAELPPLPGAANEN
jgi:segregation and condensation protein B